MKSFGRLLIVLLLAGNLLFMAALSMHVVRAPGKVAFVPKTQLTLIDAYRDTTNWTMSDLSDHPMLVAALTHAGKMDVLSHVTSVTMAPTAPREAIKVIPSPRATEKSAAPAEEPRKKTIFDIPGQN